MPEDRHGTPPRHARLARLWDALTLGQTPDASVLDSDLVAAIRQFHAIAARDSANGPDPRFVDRLWADLMSTAVPAALPTLESTGDEKPSPNGVALWVLPQSTRRLAPRRGWWALGSLATAALVLLTLVAVFSIFRHGGSRGSSDQPLVIPAISGTSATLDAVEGPVAEIVWSLDGGPGLPFHDPTALAFDPDGNLWVPDGRNGRFQIFTPDGELLETWGTSGSDDGQFNLSLGAYGYGAVVWDAEGNIYVADSGNNRIQKFTPDRTFVAAWGSRGDDDGQFLGLNYLFLDRDGRLHASDHERDDIQVFDTDGGYLGVWGGAGKGSGQFDNPGSIDQDAAGNFYVSEYLNHRVQVFSPDGMALAIIGEEGRGEGQFINPTDVTLDDRGHVIVTDYGNHRIQVFDTHGRYMASFGELGFEAGQFVNPIFAVLDGQGFIYVSDEGSDRVQKFRFLPPLVAE